MKFMGNNIISAFINIVDFANNDLDEYSTKYLIRINAVGDQLEYFVKDAISDSFKLIPSEKPIRYSEVFSWLGNQNNPPDLIIKKGDAFEVKKISPSKINSGMPSALALNSSHPKNMLYSSDPHIVKACKKCEDWDKKDIFYTVGYVQGKILKHLVFVQGICYAADNEIYANIHNPMKNEIDQIIKDKDLESSKTNELGKIKKIDPLGITDLRIRGMWSIKNPLFVFSENYEYDASKEFSAVAILSNKKYYSYPKMDIENLEKDKRISVLDSKVRDPNNPAKMIEAKIIKVEW